MRRSPRPVIAFCWACLALLLPASAAHAQDRDSLRPGNVPTFASTSDEPVLLRYKLKTDQVERVVVDADMDVNVRQGGQELAVKMTMHMEAKARVTDVDAEGNISAVVKITRMTTKVTGPNAVEFDSDKPGDDPKFQAVTAMIGVGIPCKLTPTGRLLETDLEPLRLAARRAGDAALARSVEDGAKKMFDGTYVQLSEKPVKAGDTYKAGTIDADKYKFHNSYRIRSVSGDRTQVVLEPVTEVEVTAGAFPAGVDARIKSQESAGWILFDLQKGHASKADVRLRLVLDVTAGGQTGTVEVTVKTTMTSSLE